MAGNFELNAASDIKIYLTDNPGEHYGSTKVTVTPIDDFSGTVALASVSSAPDNKLITEGTIRFNPVSLSSDKYSQGSILTVGVLKDILLTGTTSKTYELVIKGTSGSTVKNKTIKVKIYGQDWVQP